jgi:hypothetical protein
MGAPGKAECEEGPKICTKSTSDGELRAFVDVSTICITCEPPAEYTPLVPARSSQNVALGTPKPDAPLGTWCFDIGGRPDSDTDTVVTSVLGGREPEIEKFQFETAERISARDCSREGETEIQTVGYKDEEGALTAVLSREIHFSFVIVGHPALRL